MQRSKLREKRFQKKVNEVSLILLHVWSYMNDRSEQHKRTCHSKLGRGWSGGRLASSQGFAHLGVTVGIRGARQAAVSAGTKLAGEGLS